MNILKNPQFVFDIEKTDHIDLQLGKVSCCGRAAQCCRDGGLSGREPEELECRVNGVIKWGFSRKRAPTVTNSRAAAASAVPSTSSQIFRP